MWSEARSAGDRFGAPAPYKTDRRSTSERDETIGLAGNELRHDALSDVHWGMHHSFGRKVDTLLFQRVHKALRTCGGVMRIGKDERPFATQSVQFIDNTRDRSEPENDTRRQRRIFKRFHVA